LSRWRSDETLTKKAGLNALTGGLEYGAQVIVGFIVNPLLVAGLGVHGFGVWQVLRQLVGYLSPATGRSKEALKWSIATLQSSDDHEEKRRHVGSAIAISLVALPVLAVLGAVLAWFAPFWLKVEPELVDSTRIAIGLLVAALVLGPIVQLPRTVLTGQNLAYKRMGLSALIVLIGGALTVLALHLETGLVGVAAVPLATMFLSSALALHLVRKHVPWFGIARPSRQLLRRFVDLSFWFLSWNVVSRLARASDLVVLGIVGSVVLVSSYALTRFAPESLVKLVGIVVSGSTPGLGGIYGAGDLERTRRIRGEIMALTWLIATVAGVTIFLWNDTFVRMWVGGEHYAGTAANLLITLMMVQWVFLRNDDNIIDLTLDLRAKVLSSALSAVLSVALAALLISVFQLGIAGLCLGFITGRLLLTVAYPVIVGRALGLPFSTQLMAAARPVAVATVLFWIALAVDPYLWMRGWLSLVIGITVTGVVAAPVAFFAGLSATQRRRILKRLHLVLHPGAANHANDQEGRARRASGPTDEPAA
jgi:O-antigen/teichoic acid export membrane protein